MVKVFLEVFPKDLLGVPPKEEIEFKIDLLQNSLPIFILPYNIGLAEIKEFKK